MLLCVVNVFLLFLPPAVWAINQSPGSGVDAFSTVSAALFMSYNCSVSGAQLLKCWQRGYLVGTAAVITTVIARAGGHFYIKFMSAAEVNAGITAIPGPVASRPRDITGPITRYPTIPYVLFHLPVYAALRSMPPPPVLCTIVRCTS